MVAFQAAPVAVAWLRARRCRASQGFRDGFVSSTLSGLMLSEGDMDDFKHATHCLHSKFLCQTFHARSLPMPASTPPDITHYNRLIQILSNDDPLSLQTTSRSEHLLLPCQKESPPKILTLLAYLPILYATIAACIATGAPPTYFNTRHLVLLSGVFGAWLVSHGITLLVTKYLSSHHARYRHSMSSFTSNMNLDMNNPNPNPDMENLHVKPHRPLKISTLPYLLTTKDILLGLAPAILLANITCGVFSTCESWTPILGPGAGGVVLNPVGDFERNAAVWYPWLTGSVLVVQLGWFGGVVRWV